MLILNDYNLEDAVDNLDALIEMVEENNTRVVALFLCLQEVQSLEGLDTSQYVRVFSALGMAVANGNVEVIGALREAAAVLQSRNESTEQEAKS